MTWIKEFGLLRHSRGVRQGIYLAIIGAALGIAVGGELAASETSTPTPPHSLGPAGTADGAAVSAGKSFSAPALNRCEGQTWPFFNNSCLFGSDGKPDQVRMIPIVAVGPATPTPATADQKIETPRPLKATQLRKPKRTSKIYNINAANTPAIPYPSYRDAAYRDRGWAW